ncbi:hypothetical protein GJ744_010504 [Endocarpon pusillum]|uniref:Uncharacterized protein n=1 Tax=Endocarpon pusillum TaxID=364733 RepID=A0A8H7APY8_9EURO|nr:hypothetical protein GJ744_010504 [Endocarpon pusillum]
MLSNLASFRYRTISSSPLVEHLYCHFPRSRCWFAQPSSSSLSEVASPANLDKVQERTWHLGRTKTKTPNDDDDIELPENVTMEEE